MNYQFLIIALMLILSVTSQTACAQGKVSGSLSNKEQSGNVLFVAPKNWQRLDKDASTNGQTIFVAPGANESTVITVLAGEQLFGSLETWFKNFLAKNHTNLKVVSGGQIVKGSSDEGYEVLFVEQALESSDGSVSYRFYVAAHPSNRVQVIALISTDYKQYQQYKGVFDKFVESIDFVNLKNSKGKNEDLSSINSNVSSNALGGLFVGTTSRQQFNPNSKSYDYVVRQQYYLFSLDGKVYFGLPKSNIRDIELACQNDPNSCGKYLFSNSELQLTRPGQQPQTFNITKTNNGFKLGATRFYPVNSFEGLRLNGTYSFKSFTNLSGGAGGVSGGVSGERLISFSSDGRFTANNFVGFAASGGTSGATSTTTSNGQGRYEISGNTLTLIYSNANQEQFSFLSILKTSKKLDHH